MLDIIKNTNKHLYTFFIYEMYKVLAETVKIPTLGNKTIYQTVVKGQEFEAHPSFKKEFDALVAQGLLEKIKPAEKEVKVEKPKVEKETKTNI